MDFSIYTILIIILIIVLIIIFYFNSPKYIQNYYIKNYIEYHSINNKKIPNPLNVLKNPTNTNTDNNTIPNYLFQTYYDKSKIPQYIFDSIELYAKNYKYILLDDKDAIIFLKTYFIKDVVNRFNDLSFGAHKADLLRYCLLYIYGGIYLDIKTLLIKPIDEIFINKTYFYTALSKFTHSKNIEYYIYQGILASPAHNHIFLNLINFITYMPLYILNYPLRIHYLILIQHFYKEVLKDVQSKNENKKQLNFGINQGKVNTYYLFEESCSSTNDDKYNNKNVCTKLDRYGMCCTIYDNNIDTGNSNKIFMGRDPTFPWV